MRVFLLLIFSLFFTLSCRQVSESKSEIRSNTSIPKAALNTLKYVQKHGKAPEGYVGGRNFGNYEKLLPQKDKFGKKIKYREWDIYPKQDGKNRGAERLVTGSDGKVWFTKDHYNSFTEIILFDKN